MERKRFALSMVLLGGVILLFSGCKKRAINPNFVLVTLDTQRADFISAYSRNNASTPNIDSFAEKGILFENCYSLIPITLPSHASIFFSQPPYVVKNYNNGQIILKQKKRPSFVNVFKKQGFTTAAFVSLGVLDASFGLDEGFDVYNDDLPEDRWYATAEEINQRVFSWLEWNKNQRFFLWVHYSDPHAPYAPPDSPPDLKIFLNGQFIGEYFLTKNIRYEVNLNMRKGNNFLRLDIKNKYIEERNDFLANFDIFDFSAEPDQKDIKIQFKRGWSAKREKNKFLAKKRAHITIKGKSTPLPLRLTFRGKLILPIVGKRDFYKKEVEYMDREIGKLMAKLRKLKLLRKTHILMVGDHGECLGEYKGYFDRYHFGHIHFLYGVYTQVPLIIYNPFAVEIGIRRKEPVTLLDIAPSIMEIMDFDQLPSFQGRNLFSLKDKEVTIFQETYKPEAFMDVFALLKFPWHLILTPEQREYELYNLREDPAEKENIYQDIHLPPEVLSLKQRLDSFALEILRTKKEIKIDDKTKEMLRGLGYIK